MVKISDKPNPKKRRHPGGVFQRYHSAEWYAKIVARCFLRYADKTGFEELWYLELKPNCVAFAVVTCHLKHEDGAFIAYLNDMLRAKEVLRRFGWHDPESWSGWDDGDIAGFTWLPRGISNGLTPAEVVHKDFVRCYPE